MSPFGKLRLRYLSRLSVMSMMMTSSGKPSAVTTKIFQNSLKTYLSSGRKTRMRSGPSVEGKSVSPEPAPEGDQQLAGVAAARRRRFAAHPRDHQEAEHEKDDVCRPHRPEGRQ